MIRIDFVTLFPDTVLASVGYSILLRAVEAGLVEFGAANPRDFATDKHRTVDDEPYGGGGGMVLKPEPVAAAVESVFTPGATVILTDPAGRLFKQADAEALSRQSHLIFLCGHYEGIDDRLAERYAARRFSLGDFVVTGGELPAAVMADAIVRLIPGAVGSPASLEQDAFSDGLLTHPQYTRPEDWDGLKVPPVLLSGDHGEIARWRRRIRLQTTRRHRPDLFARAPLSQEDLELL
jgi:tRNA (guanine37-N1)-methyltransferase